MGLSTNRIVFGIHNITPYRRSDYLPYGTLLVLGGGTMTLSAEMEDLFGGSNKFAWASESKTITSDFTASVKSMPDFLFELFLGASVATTAASATGTVDALVNQNGTSILDAATGIASVSAKAGSEADLKDGIYMVKYASATTVDVYCLTNISFAKGTDVTFVDDSLKITATPLTVATGAAVTIPDFGLELTGGSGVIAFTDGDTAIFKVAAAHNGFSDITIGKSTTEFPEFGMVAIAQKRSNKELFEIHCFKCAGSGFPIPMEEQTFSIPELNIKLLYDDELNAIAKIRATKGL